MFTFTKMHALGNDFVVIDGIAQEIKLSSDIARTIARRKTGIGCDQILVISPSAGNGPIGLAIFNQDGSQSAQCGNGARCLARYAHDSGYAENGLVRFQTSEGILQCTIVNREEVCVQMGVPRFDPHEIPFVARDARLRYTLELESGEVQCSTLSVGNPHAVIAVDDVETAPVAELGAAIERHPRFPDRTNVGFMQVLSKNTIRLRVHERGVGETSACGSGACAAVVTGRRLGLLDAEVDVHLPGGRVQVGWQGEGGQVTLAGTTAYVFDGQWRDDE